MFMHTRFILLSLFICLCYFSARSQVYEISLGKQTLALPGRHFYVSDIIDARISKNNIGWVQRGLANARVGANLAKGFKPELTDFFNRNLPAQANLQPVIVKVLKFQVSEHTSAASESAKAEVAIDFIYHKDNTYYHLFRGIGVAKRYGLDVTAGHDDNIKAAIEQCLKQFSRESIEQYMAQAKPSTWQEISKDFLATLETHDYPILTDSTTKKGIYQTFLDFRNNQPLAAQNLVIEKVSRESKHLRNIYEVKPYLQEADGSKKPLKNVWGFSDGENVYVQYNKDYFLMDRQGNTFTFYGYGPMNTNQGAVAAGALAGGLIGGAIVGAATQKATQAEYILDMMTGHILSVENAQVKASSSPVAEYPAKITLYWWSGTASMQKLEVYVNNNLVHTLQPKTQVELEWENMSTEMNICIKNGEEACFTFIPNFKKVNYIECGVLTKGGANNPEIKPVDAKEGEFYTKKIKYLQEKNKK
jgi:hypothetical protein